MAQIPLNRRRREGITDMTNVTYITQNDYGYKHNKFSLSRIWQNIIFFIKLYNTSLDNTDRRSICSLLHEDHGISDSSMVQTQRQRKNILFQYIFFLVRH